MLLCTIVPHIGYSLAVTEKPPTYIRLDSIPDGFVLVPRHSIDKANADAAMLEFFKEQYPKLETVKDLYKLGYRFAIKVDTIQENRNVMSEQILVLTDENYKAVKKRLRHNKWEDFWQSSKVFFGFASGTLVGFLFTKTLL